MPTRRCQCVFAAPTEETLATVVESDGQTAFRVLVEPGPEGYARLQQLAHDPGLGWYVQKSFVIPGAVLHELLPQLRKADCYITPGAPVCALCAIGAPGDPPAPLRLAQAQDEDDDLSRLLRLRA
jgi:hypothetical protein